MVRPFDLRDLALVRRLGEQGITLHAVSSLADNLHPLRDALMSMFVGGEYPTFVWKPENGEGGGFIQLRIPPSSSHARILYVSPVSDPLTGYDQHAMAADAISPQASVWLALLDEAVRFAGQRGLQSVVAEVDENRPELTLLRRSGFAVYTRQDIWRVSAESYRPVSIAAAPLTARQSTDDWDIQLLYANTVPRLVQLIEPSPPAADGEIWVMRHGSELGAFVHIHRGSIATWMRFFIHPNAESEAAQIVAAALDQAFATGPSAVYCCVRRYESWLPSSLERSGFTLSSSQAVMVCHTVHHAVKGVPEAAVSLEGQRIPASSPLIRQFRQPAKTKIEGAPQE